jgi:NADH-quinone oxidoreductase subunit F
MRGYGVTVFEALPEAGGMLRYGIPQYRLPREVLKKEINAILELGIKLRTSTRVGQDVPWPQILENFDAIFLAVGAQRSIRMGIKGETLEGVHGAIEFLRQVNLSPVSPVGERVVVIGGGNSAIDAARTTLRLGAKAVHILYRRLREDMPAQREEIRAAEDEGIQIHLLASPVEIVGANGKVAAVIAQRMALGDFDASGRRRPKPIPNSIFGLEADQVIMAIGQNTEIPFKAHADSIQISDKGLVVIQQGALTRSSHPRVFAGGDVVTGPGSVVEAIAAGHAAAAEIDAAIGAQSHIPAEALSFEEKIAVPTVLDKEILERPQERMPLLAVKDRLKGFPEVEMGYFVEQASKEVCRCLRCDLQIEEEVEAPSPTEMVGAH